MRILFTIGGFGRGGKERRLISLMEFLNRNGFELALIASRNSPHLSEVRPLCREIYDYRAGQALFNLREHRRAVSDFFPDVVHSWNGSNTLYAILACAGRGVRIITSEITNSRKVPFLSLKFAQTRLSFAFSARVLSNSIAGLRAKRAPRKKARVIYNGYRLERIQGLDPEKYSQLKTLGALHVVMSARFSREKDYTTVIACARLAQKKGSKIQFVLAGDGPDLSIFQEKAKAMGLRNVTFAGHVTDIDNLLHQMDVGILTTDPRFHAEGVPNSVMECMAHGMPVMATDGGALREIVTDGVNGYLVAPRHPAALLEKLSHLESNPGRLGNMGAAASRTVKEKFDLAIMGERTAEVYREVLKKPRRDSSRSSCSVRGEPTEEHRHPKLVRNGAARAFVVVGRLHASLTSSKVKPILESGLFDQVVIFRETPGEQLNGAVYVTLPILNKLPSILRNPVRMVMEPMQLLYHTVRLRPLVLNSYYMIPKGLYTVVIAKLTNTACVLSIIGFKGDLEGHLWPKWLWKKMNLAAIGIAEACTTKGARVNEYLEAHRVNMSSVFTYNGAIDTEWFNVGDASPRDIDLLFVGHLDSRKGPDRFIDIVEAVADKGHSIRAVMLGRGKMREMIEGRISRMGPNVHVRMEGYIQDTRSYYRRAKVMLLPSTSEGLSTAVLEVMACGCVPVSSDVGCMSEAVIDGTTGCLVQDFSDTAEFARRACSLLSNPEMREMMAVAGRSLVVERYSVEAQAGCVRDVFGRALRTKRAGIRALAPDRR